MSETEPPGPDELGASEQEHEQSGSMPGGGSGPLSRLLDGNADGPQVPELMQQYGISSRPIAIACRGCVRVGTGSGIPPLAEIAIGGVLLFLSQQSGDNDEPDAADMENIDVNGDSL